ncbi:MAG: carboxylating nicotinate-nucleotide diphosphorylase [Candidatus Eisenbacteria bacterium]|nr:carboxylating nicotinate-nucleotide diphosphorylase [Candidatus Eisenbacteria bacterium]
MAAPRVSIALTEDVGLGDITTRAVVPEHLVARAVITAKEGGVLAGLQVAEIVFRQLDPDVEFTGHVKDGESLAAGRRICSLRGKAGAILTGERVALNFLQRLSGIATLTDRFVRRTRGARAKVTDTRKTTPGLRILEKYAVRVGGGDSHRFGLYDMYLVKENHVAAAGGIAEAVRRVREHMRSTKGDIPIEVEARTPEEVKEACECWVSRIMLDNMSLVNIGRSLEIVQNHKRENAPPKTADPKARFLETEVSGGVTLENVREIALTGVDYISVGALTHSYHSIDMSLLIEGIES